MIRNYALLGNVLRHGDRPGVTDYLYCSMEMVCAGHWMIRFDILGDFPGRPEAGRAEFVLGSTAIETTHRA